MALVKVADIHRSRSKSGRLIDWVVFRDPPPLHERIMLFYDEEPPPLKTARPIGRMLVIRRDYGPPAGTIISLPDGPAL